MAAISAIVLPAVDEGQHRPSTADDTTTPALDVCSDTRLSMDPPITMTLPLRPRNRSPYSRSHHPSRSPAASPAAPMMIRAHSSPVLGTSNRASPTNGAARSLSPSNSYRRYQSPSRRFNDESLSKAGSQGLSGIEEAVVEEVPADQNLRPRESVVQQPPPPVPYYSNTFPRRHRSSSPLQHVLHPSTFVPTPTAATSSPPIIYSKYNEAYPSSNSQTVSVSSASSVPSTPTSTRSRSPSISSLETIPDSPDAEEAALEAERIAMLKAAADAADGIETGVSPDPRRRSSLDVSQPGGRAGAFSIYAGRDKRKRWSVCGGERRSDLDLETIWED